MKYCEKKRPRRFQRPIGRYNRISIEVATGFQSYAENTAGPRESYYRDASLEFPAQSNYRVTLRERKRRESFFPLTIQ